MKKIFCGAIIIIFLIADIAIISSDSNQILDSNDQEIRIPYNNIVIDDTQEFLNNKPIAFTLNQGQLNDGKIRFYDQSGSIWFTDDGVWFEVREKLYNEDQDSGLGIGDSRLVTDDYLHPTGSLTDDRRPATREYKRVILKQEFLGANQVRPVGRNRMDWNSNFFYGNITSNWCTNVPNYNKIYYENIYDNIDLRYYIDDYGLKYDFIVHPGGYIEQIKMQYKGAEKIRVDNDNNLRIITLDNQLIETDLLIYQQYKGEKHIINGEFCLLNDCEYGFIMNSKYNPNEDLIIDPYIRYSISIGGNNLDSCEEVKLGPNGNIYVTGYTYSNDFPNTTGAFDNTHNIQEDIFVLKLNPTCDQILFSTYIGGQYEDYAYDLVIDKNGSAYLTGYTESSNFPVTIDAYDTSKWGSYDTIIVILNSQGSSLIHATYFGGNMQDYAYGIALDNEDRVYITGRTESRFFPITPNAYDTILDPSTWQDAFVAKFEANLTSLNYSTYLGTSRYETGYSIVADSEGNAYVTGSTDSHNFPRTVDSFNFWTADEYEAFVVKFNCTGTDLIYGAFIGGDENDWGTDIEIDDDGYIYVLGNAYSSTIVPAPNGYDTSNNGDTDLFVAKAKCDSNGSSDLKHLTFIGGSDYDYGENLAFDENGNVYVTGRTRSMSFPTTNDAFDTTHNGFDDTFISILNHNFTSLIYSTYIGGIKNDTGWGITLSEPFEVYFGGMTTSPDFPIIPGGPYDGQFKTWDIFIQKLSIKQIMNITSIKLFENNVPTNLIYSRRYPYTFRITLINSVSITDLDEIGIIIDPLGSNIQLVYDHDAGTFSEVFDPHDYVAIDHSSSFNNKPWDKWNIYFNVTFNWTYPTEEFQDVKVFSTSKTLDQASFNSFDLFKVENDLVFNGTLKVRDEELNYVNENDILKGGEIVTWSSLKVVYENTTETFPPKDEYDITIWDEQGNVWSKSTGFGELLFLNTEISSISDLDGNIHIINISGIPNSSDHTNESFTIRIDGDNVTFLNETPRKNIWVRNTEVEVGINITDVGGSLVDGKKVYYSTSMDNGTTWSNWFIMPNLKPARSIIVKKNITFEEGIDNLIKWKAQDSLGNGPVESDEYRIKIDSKNVKFNSPWPGIDHIFTTLNVTVGINISDTLSGVNASTIKYAISEDAGYTWKPWMPVVGFNSGKFVFTYINTTLPNGTDNRIKWQAYDIAGNGPVESNEYRIDINTWVKPIIPSVNLITPIDGFKANKTSVELNWELTDNALEGVTYNLHFGNRSPPDIYRSNLISTQYVIEDLEDGESYYWRIIPELNGRNGTCESGVRLFYIELPEDVKNYELYLTGINNISLFPGESKNITLTIKNLGNAENLVRIEIKSEKLSKYIKQSDTSIMKIDIDGEIKTTLILDLPKTVQAGNYNVLVTAISISSGNKETATHGFTVEVKETDEKVEDTTDSFLDQLFNNFWLLILIIIILIFVSLIFYIRKKKKAEKDLLATDPVAVKPNVVTQEPEGITPVYGTPTIGQTYPQGPNGIIGQPMQQSDIGQPETQSTGTIAQPQPQTQDQLQYAPQVPQLPPAVEQTTEDTKPETVVEGTEDTGTMSSPTSTEPQSNNQIDNNVEKVESTSSPTQTSREPTQNENQTWLDNPETSDQQITTEEAKGKNELSELSEKKESEENSGEQITSQHNKQISDTDEVS